MALESKEALIARVPPEIAPQRRAPGRFIQRDDCLSRPVLLDRKFGETSLRQRNPHHQILPSSFEGRAAKVLPSANCELMKRCPTFCAYKDRA